jgi:hypothetical protein
MMRLPLFALAAAFALGASGPVALAQPAPPTPPAPSVAAPVKVELVILHATNDGSGIDPKIGKMAELGKPPFSSYNSYKLLSRSQLSLDKAKLSTTKLPNDRELGVTLKDVQAAKSKGEPAKYVVNASIKNPGGNTFLPLLEVNAKAGEPFFVAGQTYKGGVLVIGFKVVP